MRKLYIGLIVFAIGVIVLISGLIVTCGLVACVFPALSPTTETPSTIAESPQCKVIKIEAKVTGQTSWNWLYSWKLILENPTSKVITLDAHIQFLDADGFILRTDYLWDISLDAEEQKTFTDSTYIDLPAASDVKNINAKLKYVSFIYP